jgi:hypothetical protein
LLPDLLKIYEAIGLLWQYYIPDLDVEEDVNGIYAARGLVFDLIVSLGYEERYERWQAAKLVKEGIITPEEAAYVDEKYETKGVTP